MSFDDDLSPCLKHLIQSADVAGVRRFLALNASYEVPPRLVNLAAALPFSVASADVASKRGDRRDVLVVHAGSGVLLHRGRKHSTP